MKNNIHQIKEKQIKNLDKENLIKLINLFELIIDKNILDYMEEESEKIIGIRKDIIQSTLNSLVTDIFSKKYIKKIYFQDISIYYYKKYINIYIKKISDDVLKNIKIEIANFDKKEIELKDINTNDRIILFPSENRDTEIKEFIKNKNNIIIKINY